MGKSCPIPRGADDQPLAPKTLKNFAEGVFALQA
jgi:hypothetical protein